MTDSDIIKALECCCKNNSCEGCPLDYFTFSSSQCASELAIKSLDLINRQHTEIERLRKEVNLVSIQFQDLQERYEEAQTEIERLTKETMNMAITIESCQGEAITEFAERLKNELGFGHYIQPDQINNLVKEYEKGR